MKDKIYRTRIVIQEYDGDGFWDVFDSIEMADSKEKLIKSFEKITSNGRKYIEERLI